MKKMIPPTITTDANITNLYKPTKVLAVNLDICKDGENTLFNVENNVFNPLVKKSNSDEWGNSAIEEKPIKNWVQTELEKEEDFKWKDDDGW